MLRNAKLMSHCLVLIYLDVGIRTNMPQRNEDQLKKVTQMVKDKNYKHKELAVLKQQDIVRMKV